MATKPRPADNVTALWLEHLIRTKKGQPRALLANAIIALRFAPEWQGILAYNEFSARIEIKGKLPWQEAAKPDEPWADADDIRLADWLQHQGIAVNANVAGQAVEAVARDHAFHPVRDYLRGLVWDRTRRLDTWAINYLGVKKKEDDEEGDADAAKGAKEKKDGEVHEADAPKGLSYVRAVSSKWMISAIARVMRPGCKADCALILEGPQGSLKSTALHTLGRPWFTDDLHDLGSKDAALQIIGRWIVEMPELDSIGRVEVTKVKAFMSRSTDRFRPPYGKRVIEAPRQSVFGGTVNKDEYLKDETGGRRWWPLKCGKIDIPGLAAIRDQLWAEALVRYEAGEPWHLDTADLVELATDEQSARYAEDVWQPVVEEYVATRTEVTREEVLKNALLLDLAKCGQPEANRVARCLTALKWKRKQKRIKNGKPYWRYVRPPEPPKPGDQPELPIAEADR